MDAKKLSGSLSTKPRSLGGNLPGQFVIGVQGPPGPQGSRGEEGGYYIPTATQIEENVLQISFIPSKPDMPAIEPVRLQLIPTGEGAAGESGEDGATFIPYLDTEGNLSWTNDKGLDNPETINIRGPQGPAGAIGETGPVGPQGKTGETGPTGATGPQGIQGVAGPQGPQGEKGDKGDKGDTGPEGPQGKQGEAGKDGSPGADGTPGEDGVGIASIKQTTTSTADGGNNVFTVILTDGNSTNFMVKNGSKGSTGETGPQGPEGPAYTLTAADKADITAAVVAALPVYNGEVTEV